jgi:hypothetical protein
VMNGRIRWRVVARKDERDTAFIPHGRVFDLNTRRSTTSHIRTINEL